MCGAVGPYPLDPKLQPIGDDSANGHLNQAQRTLLDSLEPPDEEEGNAKKVVTKGSADNGKPVRHSLHRTPTQAQQARWEAMQQAKSQGLSLRAITRKLGISRVAVRKYASAESPPTKLLSARERAKAEALHASLVAAD